MKAITLIYLLGWFTLSVYADTDDTPLDSLYRIATNESNEENYQKIIDTALSISSNSEVDQKRVFEFYYLFGYRYSSKNSINQALDYYNHSLDISVRLNDLNRQRRCAVVISKAYQKIGQYSEASTYTIEALELSKELFNDTLTARYLYDLGIIYWRSHQVDKAFLSLEKSLLMYYELKDKSMASYALLEMGICFDKVGRYKEAIEYYYRALNINNDSELLRSKVYNNHSRALIALGDTVRSFDMVKKSIALKKKINNSDMLVPALNNLGVLHLKNHQIDSALICFVEAYYLNSLSGDNGANAYELKESFSYLDSIQTIKNDRYLLVDLGIYKRYGEFIEWNLSTTEINYSNVANYAAERVSLREERRIERDYYQWTIAIISILAIIIFGVAVLYFWNASNKKVNLINGMKQIEEAS